MPSATLSMTIPTWERFRAFKKTWQLKSDDETIRKLLDQVGFGQ